MAVLVDRSVWHPYSTLGRLIRNTSRWETFLSFYGPLTLLLVIGVWATVLIVGFALFQWTLGSQVAGPEKGSHLWYGPVFERHYLLYDRAGRCSPTHAPAGVLTVVEAGSGFAIFAVVIGYLPILYQSFSRREVPITLIDARAGSHPRAVDLLSRYSQRQHVQGLGQLLSNWEMWAAEVMESHLSYPALGYFRLATGGH